MSVTLCNKAGNPFFKVNNKHLLILSNSFKFKLTCLLKFGFDVFVFHKTFLYYFYNRNLLLYKSILSFLSLKDCSSRFEIIIISKIPLVPRHYYEIKSHCYIFLLRLFFELAVLLILYFKNVCKAYIFSNTFISFVCFFDLYF